MPLYKSASLTRNSAILILYGKTKRRKRGKRLLDFRNLQDEKTKVTKLTTLTLGLRGEKKRK